MTVIACDGKTIAADSMGDAAGAKVRVNKLWRISNGWVGFSGLAAGTREMLQWIEAGCKDEDRPAIQQDDQCWMRALVLWDDETVSMVEKWGMFRVHPPAAIGSGQDFALAAMALGLSPREAVELTCKLSTGCGLPVASAEVRADAQTA